MEVRVWLYKVAVCVLVVLLVGIVGSVVLDWDCGVG